MRNGVGWARRLATGIAVTLVAAMAMGTGIAGAASSLDSYSATASGTTFNVAVQLPAALGEVLNNVLGTSGSKIEERISFSNATSNVIKDKAPVGSAFGQVFKGTLDNLLLQVAKTPLIGYTGAKLPEASASLGQKSANSMKAIELLDGLVHIGIAEAEASSSKNATNPRVVDSTSASRLLGVKVDLSKLGSGALENLLKPVLDIVEGDASNPNDGLLGTINGALKGIGDTLNVNLALPSVSSFLDKPLVSVGIIESISKTGATGTSRWAEGITRLANVDLLGGYVHADVIKVRSFATIDGTAAGARNTTATVDLATVKLGNTTLLNLDTRQLTVANKTIDIPLDLNDQLKGLIDVLGVKLSLAPKPSITRNATHARAAASSLHLEVAPKLLSGAPLLSVALDGPAAVADVRGSNVLGITTVAHPRTGVSDQLFLLVGPALLGLAIVTRRFVLAK
jgi:hypothetical protein